MSKFLEDFGYYLFAFADKWLFWIGIIMLLGDLLEQKWPAFKAKLDKWLPRWAFGSLAVAFLVLASFQVWHEEYEKTHPGLKLTLDEWGFAEALVDDNGKSLVKSYGAPAVIVATLRNLGAPSVADDWSLYISCRFSEGRDPGFSKPFPPEFLLSPGRAQCALTGVRMSNQQSSWNVLFTNWGRKITLI